MPLSVPALTSTPRKRPLPFDPLVPNEATIAAMKEARRGGLPPFKDVKGLLADLHAKD